MAKVKCPSCGRMNYDINDWCLNCKTDLKDVRRPNLPVTACMGCGKLNIGSFQYCTFCGKHMDNIAYPEMKVEEEVAVLVRYVKDLPPEEALFYAKENNLANRDVYLRKIHDLENQLKNYKDMLAGVSVQKAGEQKDLVGQAVNKVTGAVKDMFRSPFEAMYYEDYKEPETEKAESLDDYKMAEAGAQEYLSDGEDLLQNHKEVSSGVNKAPDPEINSGGVDTAAKAEKTEEKSSSFMPFAPEPVKKAFIRISKEYFFDNVVLSQLKPKIENRIDSGEYALSADVKTKTPEQIVFLIIADIIAEEFSKSSDCFLFKAVLSTKGRELMRAWIFITKELLKSGAYSKTEYDEAVQRINDIAQSKNNG